MEKLDYNDVFNLISSVGTSLNCNLGKPIKGRFVESTICKTIPDCDHVDMEGYDLLVSGVHKIEVKSLQNCLYTKKGKAKDKTSKITIKNVRGKGVMTIEEICAKFHELYVVDTGSFDSYSVARILSCALLDPNIATWSESKDGRQVQINTKYLEFLCNPQDIIIDKNNNGRYNTEAAKIITDISLHLIRKDLQYVNVDEVCRHIQRNWRISSRNQKCATKLRVRSVGGVG